MEHLGLIQRFSKPFLWYPTNMILTTHGPYQAPLWDFDGVMATNLKLLLVGGVFFP
jgi:hypothetical protein